MAHEVRLTADGERALREAARLCWRMNVAIESPEHLLAGALLVLGEAGAVGLPDRAQIEEALLLVHGAGAEPLRDQVLPGPAARAALAFAASRVREAGRTELDARALALGVIDSGEVNPVFYAGLRTDREQLRGLINR